MADDDELIPGDHPIRRIWDENQRMRDDPLALALEGDQEQMRSWLSGIHLRARRQLGLERAEPNRIDPLSPEQWRLLMIVTERILSGATPDEAMGWKHQGRGRPEKGHEQRVDDALLAHRVGKLRESGKSLEEACAIAADEMRSTEAKARKAWDAYRIRGK